MPLGFSSEHSLGLSVRPETQASSQQDSIPVEYFTDHAHVNAQGETVKADFLLLYVLKLVKR